MFERRKNEKEGKTHLFKLTYFKLCPVPMAPFYYISKTAISGLPNTSLPQRDQLSFPFALYYEVRKWISISFPEGKIFFLHWENQV